MKTLITLSLLISGVAMAETSYRSVNNRELGLSATQNMATGITDKEIIPYVDKGENAEVMCYTGKGAAQMATVPKRDLLNGTARKCSFLVSGVGITMFGYISRMDLVKAQNATAERGYNVRSSRQPKNGDSVAPSSSTATQ